VLTCKARLEKKLFLLTSNVITFQSIQSKFLKSFHTFIQICMVEFWKKIKIFQFFLLPSKSVSFLKNLPQKCPCPLGIIVKKTSFFAPYSKYIFGLWIFLVSNFCTTNFEFLIFYRKELSWKFWEFLLRKNTQFSLVKKLSSRNRFNSEGKTKPLIGGIEIH